MAPTPAPPSLSEGWDDEAGSHAAPGITRVLVETFKVGGYTYTNLADAEPQARRMPDQGAGL